MNDERPAHRRALADARNVEDNDTSAGGRDGGDLSAFQRRRWSPLTVDGILMRPPATAQAHDLAMALGKVMRRDGTFLPLRGPDDGLCVEVRPHQRDRVQELLDLSTWSWGEYRRGWEKARLAHRCPGLPRGGVRLFFEPFAMCPVPGCGETLPASTDDPESDVADSNEERGSEQRSALLVSTEIVLPRGDASRDEEGDASLRRSRFGVHRGLAQEGLSASARRFGIVAVRREHCPECGATSAEPGYSGHAMHCRAFWTGS